MARHALPARDEMQELVDELLAMARGAAVPTPALGQLCRYMDAQTPAAVM